MIGQRSKRLTQEGHHAIPGLLRTVGVVDVAATLVEKAMRRIVAIELRTAARSLHRLLKPID
jgi:hypothetical protein